MRTALVFSLRPFLLLPFLLSWKAKVAFATDVMRATGHQGIRAREAH